jgi:hypothetical protein
MYDKLQQLLFGKVMLFLLSFLNIELTGRFLGLLRWLWLNCLQQPSPFNRNPSKTPPLVLAAAAATHQSFGLLSSLVEILDETATLGLTLLPLTYLLLLLHALVLYASHPVIRAIQLRIDLKRAIEEVGHALLPHLDKL